MKIGFSYRGGYYWRHPRKFVREVRILVANAYHRMRYGFAWVDLWNMDDYLGQLVPNMLRELAARSCGYPGNEDFPNDDVYKAYLNALACLFEYAQIDMFDEDYEGARTCVLELRMPEYPLVEQLYADARAYIGDDIPNWKYKLTEFVYRKLGEASARGLLWD